MGGAFLDRDAFAVRLLTLPHCNLEGTSQGEEGSLLILAMLFTAVVWYLARENVRSEYVIEGVVVRVPEDEQDKAYKVELDKDPKIGEATVTVHLYCSERAHQEIKQRLRLDEIKFVRGDAPGGPWRVIGAEYNDSLVYPSAAARYIVEEKMQLPKGRVLRLNSYTIDIDEPDLPLGELAAKGIGVQIVQQLDRQITATLPKNSIGTTNPGETARIRPDPLTPSGLGLDRDDLESRLGTEFKVPLSFELWRAEKDKDTGEPYPGRKGLKLPESAYVVVKLYRNAERALTNRVVYVAPPQWGEDYELELAEVADIGVTGQGGRETLFTGTVVGTEADLRALEKDPRGWFWAIIVSAEAEKDLDDIDANNTSANLPVTFALVLLEKFQNRRLQFKPTKLQAGHGGSPPFLKVKRREP